MRQLGVYTTLAVGELLTVGPRLTGSAQADSAVRLMAGHMTDLGFNVLTSRRRSAVGCEGDVEKAGSSSGG